MWTNRHSSVSSSPRLYRCRFSAVTTSAAVSEEERPWLHSTSVTLRGATEAPWTGCKRDYCGIYCSSNIIIRIIITNIINLNSYKYDILPLLSFVVLSCISIGTVCNVESNLKPKPNSLYVLKAASDHHKVRFHLTFLACSEFMFFTLGCSKKKRVGYDVKSKYKMWNNTNRILLWRHESWQFCS